MQSRIIRVLPAECGWALEFGGLDMQVRRFPTMEAAIAAGWDVAIRENAELLIQRHSGDRHLRDASDDEPR